MDTDITRVFTEYGVEKVIYGHLHGPSLSRVFQGKKDGVEYILTSADYINFDPIKIF
jgi:predicted phosphohydrolase